ncbi:HNH endonuclease [Micromonospora soli]
MVAAEVRWRRANPDAIRSRNSLRRARKRAVRYEVFRHEEIFERDGWRCQICRRMTDRTAPRFHPRSPTLDHVIPLSQGGPHTRANTRCACFECNSKRGDRGGNEQLALI